MFNVILKIAAGAALVAASNYTGKAIGEKLAREPAFQKAKKAKAARELANLLIDVDARAFETDLHKQTWELHQEAKASGCEGLATAMVVEEKEKPHVGLLSLYYFLGAWLRRSGGSLFILLSNNFFDRS